MENRLTGLIIALLSAAGWLQAQSNKVDTLRTYWIDEVTVTSQKKLSKEIIPVQIMEGIQLEKLSAHSVADAIRYFAGIQIKDFGGIGGLKTVNIRSMGTNHVGVFYDGIELGNAQNGQIDLGRFSLENMEAVSVYNGQRSAIFQSAKDYGSSGTIYLQSRTPEFKDTKKFNVRAGLKAGSFDVVNPSVLWEQKLSDKVFSSFSTEYMYTTGRYKYRYLVTEGYDTTAVRKNGDVNSLRVESGLYGKLTDGEWRSKAYFYRSERGLPGAMVRNKLFHEDRQWDTNFFFQSSFRKHFSNRYSLLVNGKYAYDYLHYLADPNKDETLMYVNNHYRQQEAYFSAANLYSFSKHWSASMAVDYQWNTLDADLFNFPYPTRHTVLVSLASALDLERVKLQASVLGTFIIDRVRTDTVAMENKQKITPTLVASYRPFSKINLNVRAFYKNIFRMPTFNDLYYTFIGSIKLKPEITNQYNIGMTYSPTIHDKWLQLFEMQADVYYNEVQNKIIAMPASNQFRWTMINLGFVEIRGVDVAMQTGWLFPHDIRVNTRLSYTYQKAQDFTDPELYYGDQIPYTPWHNGSFIVNASWRSWDANYSFIYTGKRYNQSANIPENYVPEWYTSDLSVAKNFRLRKLHCKLTAEINNLFNQQFEVVRSYPMPGTNYKFILNVTI